VYVDIGRAVELARTSAGISQAELGRRLPHPLTRSAIGNIELGRQRILTHTLIEIAAVPGIHPRMLLPAHPPERATTSAADLARAREGIIAGCLAQGLPGDLAERIAIVVTTEEV
jgi:transcriptional regulator with XRE-family HTH domain